MVCEPGRKSGYDRIGLLLQLAQIHAEYLGNRSFSREGARKSAKWRQIFPTRRGKAREVSEKFTFVLQLLRSLALRPLTTPPI
jgi:hypothetical protein